jgi:methyl-accepting chemotaxis protein
MAGLNDVKMKPKLLWGFLLAGLLPLIIVGFYSTELAHAALEKAAFDQLHAMRVTKKNQIRDFFQAQRSDLELLAQSPDMRRIFAELVAYHDRQNVDPAASFPVGTAEYDELVRREGAYLKNFIETYSYDDVLLICAVHGHVMLTLEGQSDLGANLSAGSLQGSVLGKLWQRVVETRKTVFADFEPYGPADGSPEAFIGAPLLATDGRLIGVVALEVQLAGINRIMQERAGMGETSEAYLVGPEGRMRSDSYLDSAGRSVAASFVGTVEKNGVDTEVSREALAGRKGEKLISDYRNTEVLSSYAPLDIIGVRWGILAEIDMEEVDLPIAALRKGVIGIGVVIAVLVGLFAFWLAAGIARPIEEITQTARSLATGDLGMELSGDDREDEIGELGKAFAQMVESTRGMVEAADRIAGGDLTVEVQARSERDMLGQALANMTLNLRRQMGEMGEGANVLVASIREILASTTQVASGSTETAAAVTQTTTTMEEVKQTIQTSSQKAGEVSENSRQVAQNSQQGLKATDAVVIGMEQISEQMESIAESVVRLSEQSQAIEGIITTVDDIAEQSNLLAVNASIEAVKAGEEGKTFSVVAEEIKSLAEQSKQATGQVRSILSDIQRGTSAAVMGAEQGSKVVEAGMGQSGRAGEAIRLLVEKIEGASQSALQIAASNQEQMAGVDQVAAAMENVRQGSSQNAASIQQVEQSARELDELGQRLKALVEQYRI